MFSHSCDIRAIILFDTEKHRHTHNTSLTSAILDWLSWRRFARSSSCILIRSMGPMIWVGTVLSNKKKRSMRIGLSWDENWPLRIVEIVEVMFPYFASRFHVFTWRWSSSLATVPFIPPLTLSVCKTGEGDRCMLSPLFFPLLFSLSHKHTPPAHTTHADSWIVNLNKRRSCVCWGTQSKGLLSANSMSAFRISSI